jgi:putative phosphoserine phosphatase/1-acylglycerol-3-phosphate O-acyltransferase
VIAAIFDLDRTLVAGSTGTMVIEYLREQGLFRRYIRRRDAGRLLGGTLLYRFGHMDATRLMQATVASVRGIPVRELWEMVEGWFDAMVSQRLAPGGLERLQWHVDQGHLPIICTASSQFSALPVARHLAIPHAVYSEWQDDGTQMTGTVRLPIVFGTGKVFWVRKWAAEHGVALRESYFYSDDISDQPLLEMVGYPAAVNPTSALRRLAERRGYPVLRWY